MRSAIIHDDAAIIELRGTHTSARARPLAHHPTTAQLITYGELAIPTPADLTRWLAALADHGFRTVRTGALYPSTARVFEANGFQPIQHLTLMEAVRPSARHAPRRPSRAMTPADVAEAAHVDTLAFGVEWGLDEVAVRDVCRATASFRARVVDVHGQIVATAITGRDGDLGFVQRVAVLPAHQRCGHATGLLADALRWLGRWRTKRVLVNTHVDNRAALALYAAHGFAVLDQPLFVAERRL